jgi:guanidinopropionase
MPSPLNTPRFCGHVSLFRTAVAATAKDIDIALCGIPFDSGTLGRNGSRLGPRAVRDVSMQAIRPVHPLSNESPFENCRVADVGDAMSNPLDIIQAMDQITAFFAEIHAAGALPLAIGGDHLVTLPVLRALAKDRPVGLVHFDSHTDTYEGFYGQRYNNGTTFRRAVEEGLIDPKRSLQIGIRGPRFGKEDVAYSLAAGMRVITIDEFFDIGTAGVIAEIKAVATGPCYVSFDIDSIDAVYVPGTGAPEIGGYTPRDAQVMIRSLSDVDIIGADVVEVSPALDPTDGTARVAANMAFELLDVMARQRRGQAQITGACTVETSPNKTTV